MTYLSPTAKAQLSKTIRNLRDRLITDLHNAVESTYLMGVKLEQVQLDEERYCKRERLERYLEELVKGDLAVCKGKQSEKVKQEFRDRHRQDLEKLAAATWLNRLAVIKHLEAMGLLKPKLVTGGWQSAAFKEFRDYAPEFLQEEDQGYGLLLQLVFDELAIDLSGLFGRGGLNGYGALVPMPAATLRYLIEELDKVEADAWRDDTTLGWIYQYWNDPERESIDQKMNEGGKVEPHEIASKTQMFTERYMVEWLLQNSLNNQWLDICAANGWIAEAVSDRTLENLEVRRQMWRQKREAGEVALDELMGIENEQEQRWKYWVKPPNSLTDTGLKPLALPETRGLSPLSSLRTLKLIDPACGSGHFLVIAFDLLFAFYQEEARHRGEVWTDAEIANSILENNLYGIDIDARAVQMAAAALWLKAKGLCKDAAPRQINLVAANLNLANLPKDDPELLAFCEDVRQETGIPPRLTMQIVEALQGADVWGSLLRVDQAVVEAIADHERQVKVLLEPEQGDLFRGFRPAQARLDFNATDTKLTILESLERFLQVRSQSDDLGVRLWGEQLAAGVRFVRMVREGQYDLVIGNPPYQGTSKMADAGYLSKHYAKGKADLYAAFLQRGLELAKDGGFSALLTMRNWMFISQYSAIREFLIENYDLRLLGDLETGAFEGISGQVVSVSMTIFQKLNPSDRLSIAIQPKTSQISESSQQTPNKRAALLAQMGRYEFKTRNFNVIKEKPLIYWWEKELIQDYISLPKIGDIKPVNFGTSTANNTRFIRYSWELPSLNVFKIEKEDPIVFETKWHPFINGGKGRKWIEPLTEIINWKNLGFECKNLTGATIRNAHLNWESGVAFVMIGSEFSARIHRYKSVIGNKGASVFSENIDELPYFLMLLNSVKSKEVMSSLNPGVGFEVGDVKRLPLFPIESADEIFGELEKAFSEHEAGRETSVEFISPRPSPWRTAQNWAQAAVDRPAGAPLPPHIPTYDPPSPQDFVSYAIGLALGRFPEPDKGLKPLAYNTEENKGLKPLVHNTEENKGLKPLAHNTEENKGLKPLAYNTEENKGLKPLAYNTEENKGLKPLAHNTEENKGLKPLAYNTEENKGLKPLAHNTEENKGLKPLAHNTEENKGLKPLAHNTEENKGLKPLAHTNLLYLSTYSHDLPDIGDSLTHPAMFCPSIRHGQNMAQISLKKASVTGCAKTTSKTTTSNATTNARSTSPSHQAKRTLSPSSPFTNGQTTPCKPSSPIASFPTKITSSANSTTSWRRVTKATARQVQQPKNATANYPNSIQNCKT